MYQYLFERDNGVKVALLVGESEFGFGNSITYRRRSFRGNLQKSVYREYHHQWIYLY